MVDEIQDTNLFFKKIKFFQNLNDYDNINNLLKKKNTI